MSGWQLRIVDEGEEDPAQLAANPRNWRIHSAEQQELIGASLETFGWLRKILVNRRTGYVLNGHARVLLALRRGEPRVPVRYVDLTPEQEAVALATFDPLATLAEVDADRLDALTDASGDADPFGAFLLDYADSHRPAAEVSGLPTDAHYAPNPYEEKLAEQEAGTGGARGDGVDPDRQRMLSLFYAAGEHAELLDRLRRYAATAGTTSATDTIAALVAEAVAALEDGA